MKKTHIGTLSLLALSLVFAGCAAHYPGTYGNRDYKNTSFQGGGANSDIIFTGHYASPHSF